MARSGTEKAWRKRPSTILWMLSLGQLISWGLVYYTFPLFVVPMTQEDAVAAADLWSPGTPLSLADRVCLATADRLGVPVLTADMAWGDADGIRQIR